MIGTRGGINHVTLLVVITRNNSNNSIAEVAITLQQLFFTVIILDISQWIFHVGNAASLSCLFLWPVLFYVTCIIW